MSSQQAKPVWEQLERASALLDQLCLPSERGDEPTLDAVLEAVRQQFGDDPGHGLVVGREKFSVIEIQNL